MFIVLGILVLFCPPIATAMSFIVGVLLYRERKALAAAILALSVFMAICLLWEFRYDLGIPSPDRAGWLEFFPGEVTLAVIVVLEMLTLFLARIQWPPEKLHAWLPMLTTLLWGAILLAGLVLSQANFMY